MILLMNPSKTSFTTMWRWVGVHFTWTGCALLRPLEPAGLPETGLNTKLAYSSIQLHLFLQSWNISKSFCFFFLMPSVSLSL